MENEAEFSRGKKLRQFIEEQASFISILGSYLATTLSLSSTHVFPVPRIWRWGKKWEWEKGRGFS